MPAVTRIPCLARVRSESPLAIHWLEAILDLVHRRLWYVYALVGRRIPPSGHAERVDPGAASAKNVCYKSQDR